MAKYWLINPVLLASGKKLPGDLIDDTVDNVTQIRAAGGVLWPFADSIVADAAAAAQVARLGKAINEQDLSNRMTAATNDSTMLTNSNQSPNLSQATWYIDPTRPNESGSGKTAASALKTFAELQRRLGLWTTIMPGGGDMVVNVLNDLPTNDPIIMMNIIGKNSTCKIIGKKKVLATGTLSGAAYRDRATNAPHQIVAAVSQPVDYWTQYVGKMVYITSGPATGARAVVLADDNDFGSPRTAHMSEWIGAIDGLGGPVYADAWPAAGATYQICDFTSAQVGHVTVGCMANSDLVTPLLVIQQFSFNQAFIPHPEEVASSWESLTSYADCLFVDVFQVDVGKLTTFGLYANCGFLRSNVIVTGEAWIFAGGFRDCAVYTNGAFGGSVFLGMDVSFFGGSPGPGPNGTFSVSTMSMWGGANTFSEGQGSLLFFGANDQWTSEEVDHHVYGVLGFAGPYMEATDGGTIILQYFNFGGSVPRPISEPFDNSAHPSFGQFGGHAIGFHNWMNTGLGLKGYAFNFATGAHSAPFDVSFANFAVASPAGFLNADETDPPGNFPTSMLAASAYHPGANNSAILALSTNFTP